MLRLLLLLALPLTLLTGVSSAQVTQNCFGDGYGRTCKCGNDDALNPGTGGCLNSAGTGAVLGTNGSTGIAENNLQFTLSGGVPGALAVLTSGDNRLGGGIGVLGTPASDGLRCVGGNFKRHGARALDSLGNRHVGWGAPGTAPMAGIIGQVGFLSGQTRHFQARYRDNPVVSPCGSGTNTTQAINITFAYDNSENIQVHATSQVPAMLPQFPGTKSTTLASDPCTVRVQQACIAAGMQPCIIGTNSAVCGGPPYEPCTSAVQMACMDLGFDPCTVGVNNGACGPVTEPCTMAAQDACIATNFEPCTIGTNSADCGEFVDPCTAMVLQACIDDEGLCACDSATGDCIANDEVLDVNNNCCLTSELDCLNICFGPNSKGSQGNCCLPAERDCAGECFGPRTTGSMGGCCDPAFQDCAGECGGNVGPDCAGVCFGESVFGANGGCCLVADLDACSVCNGDGTGVIGCGSGTVCGGVGSCECDVCNCPAPSFGVACSCTELSGEYNGIYQHSFIDNIPETLMVNTASLTAEMWIKPTKIGAALMTRLGGGVQWGWSMGVSGSTVQPNTLRMWNGDGCAACTLVGNTVIPLNVWSHVAFVYDHTIGSGKVSLYVNGVLDKVGNYAPRPVNPGQLLIGLFGTNYFGGSIDDVRMWSVARTATQIADNYDKSLSGINMPTLVFNHNYQKWRPGDTECVDFSSSDNHLIHSLFVEQGVNNSPAPPTVSDDACPTNCNSAGVCQCGVCTCFNPADLSFDCSDSGGTG